MAELKIIAMNNMREMGEKIEHHLKKMNKVSKNYLVNVDATRFNNGEGKVLLKEDCKDKDIFILSDVGNYGITYEMHGIKVPMSPDEHFQDIKRVISALSGSAKKITVIMPFLYQSRQDRRNGRESLDCALALQELEDLHVGRIVTFDAHEPKVSNAIPNTPFENFFPTDFILEKIVKDEHPKNTLVISPDIGAMGRARYFSELIHCDVGLFYKRRDLSKIINGKNPIVEHVYMGADVNEKTCLVVDDMIASGSSMIEVGLKLKEKKAKKIFFIATFSLFSEGMEAFDAAYEKGIFDKLYTTDLTYIPNDFKNREWLKIVDSSRRMSEIIDTLHDGRELAPFKTEKI